MLLLCTGISFFFFRSSFMFVVIYWILPPRCLSKFLFSCPKCLWIIITMDFAYFFHHLSMVSHLSTYFDYSLHFVTSFVGYFRFFACIHRISSCHCHCHCHCSKCSCFRYTMLCHHLNTMKNSARQKTDAFSVDRWPFI